MICNTFCPNHFLCVFHRLQRVSWCELGIVTIKSQLIYQMVHTSAYTMAYSYAHMPHIKLTQHSRYKIGTQARCYITKLFFYTAVAILFSKQTHVTRLTQHPACYMHPTEHMQHNCRCNSFKFQMRLLQ